MHTIAPNIPSHLSLLPQGCYVGVELARIVALRLVPDRLILEKIRKFFAGNHPALDQVWN
jgi:hypothetical protein